MTNKQKKKRNKVYRGAEAALDRPVITKFTAVNRSGLGQWWFDHKRIVRPIAIAVLVASALGWLIYELLRIAANT